jgi:hypothetical protein
MTIEEQVVEKLRELPPEKQKEVLEFLDSLKKSNGAGGKLRSLEGLLEEFNIDVTEEEITAARHEMWSNFPREI